MTPRRPSLAELVDGVRTGERAALSRAITLAESRLASDQALAQELMVALSDRIGGAVRIGLTGVPGAGKSTTIEALGLWLIERGHRVAVLVIDPSSARTGGSILGDKTRMPRLAVADAAYIRPSPSAGVLGGVAWRTREAMLLCEAAGFDVVIVESVGVGQSESELAEIVDTFCLLLVPAGGDELQGIKRGVVELADVIAVNKADGELAKAARRAAGDYRHALHMLPPATPGWSTPVLTYSAREGTGLEELWAAIGAHRAHLEASGQLRARRAEQQRHWLGRLLAETVLARFRARPGFGDAYAAAERAVADGTMTVPQAVAALTGDAGGSAGA
ncbi:methylmalonyl Co-A mutase-associated GTPase MeaB [Conexibacter sp. DBS9H8]|uniref:methylmalonyl Co-A mutase-associated GTPase MeaB n=1 Tax=Conexibacter sp. DBS9H8 TaxID=2937801 RepID=UPI0020106074|nr:methylmalonyl Co-A mutase-associated GTPase MeaB [Conexibacter sp. DBS9H8]